MVWLRQLPQRPRRLRYDSVSKSLFEMRIWQSKLRITALLAVILVFLAATSLWRSKVKAKRDQTARDASRAQILSTFRQELRLGMHRSEVYDYLRLHSVKFYDGGGYSTDTEVFIGQDSASLTKFPCYAWDIYVVFHFDVLPKQPTQSPLDNLSNISIEKQCEK
jgi:hypothetical protein